MLRRAGCRSFGVIAMTKSSSGHLRNGPGPCEQQAVLPLFEDRFGVSELDSGGALHSIDELPVPACPSQGAPATMQGATIPTVPEPAALRREGEPGQAALRKAQRLARHLRGLRNDPAAQRAAVHALCQSLVTSLQASRSQVTLQGPMQVTRQSGNEIRDVERRRNERRRIEKGNFESGRVENGRLAKESVRGESVETGCIESGGVQRGSA